MLKSHGVASFILHLLLILKNNLTLSWRNNLLRHLWNFIRNSFVTSLPGGDHPKLWWLIKHRVDFVSKSLKLRASLSCWRWLLDHLEIAFILRMDLLSLSLNHIDIVVSCRLSLTTMPFWSRHFLCRVKRSCGFITSLISLLLRLQSFLILLHRRYLMQVHFAGVLFILLIRVNGNASSILHNLKFIILPLLIWLILTWFIYVLTQFSGLRHHLVSGATWVVVARLLLVSVNLL